MDKQNLIIFKCRFLYEIIKELEESINFKIFESSSEKNLKDSLNKFQDYLVVTQKKINDIENQFILNELPIKISKLIEKINIEFIKFQFNQNSELTIGKYKIDLNSRFIKSKDNILKLTEKESNIIVYLSKSKSVISIDKLQTEVWGHQSKLETHTVETHIYRLRKKILKTFNDEFFIISKKNGYQII